MAEAPDWSKFTQGLSCKSETLSPTDVGTQDYFAIVYHCTTSIRSRCHRNVGRIEELSFYVGEAIASSRTSSGHQLVVRSLSTPDGKIEITVCSDDPEESSRRLAEFKERIKTLTERIIKMGEEERKRIIALIIVEMKLDAAINKILLKIPAGEIYPTIGIIRETLIKTLAGFDPIHIETSEIMEALHDHSPNIPLDRGKSVSFSMKILDWRKRLSRIVEGEPPSS
nr:hypothetical protein [Candidatus Njordarchaeum guaymaensis]